MSRKGKPKNLIQERENQHKFAEAVTSALQATLGRVMQMWDVQVPVVLGALAYFIDDTLHQMARVSTKRQSEEQGASFDRNKVYIDMRVAFYKSIVRFLRGTLKSAIEKLGHEWQPDYDSHTPTD